MPFIPETENDVKTGASSKFTPDSQVAFKPRMSLTESPTGSLPVIKQLTNFGVGFGSEIGKAGLGLGETFLKTANIISNVQGLPKNQYNPLIDELQKLKENLYDKPFETEKSTLSGGLGELTGKISPFTATTKAVSVGQEVLGGLTRRNSILGSSKVIPYLVKKFSEVIPEAIISGVTELGVSGGDTEKAKEVAIGAGIFSTLSHVGSDVYRSIIPQDVKTNALKSLNLGKVSLKDIGTDKKSNDIVEAYTTISRLAPDIKVIDRSGIEKQFDVNNPDFVELPQALYQAKNKVYEAYTNLAKQAGDNGAEFTAKDFYSVIDDLKKYDKAGYTQAYSNKANQIIEALQRFVKVGERGQKYFDRTELSDIQRLIENINTDVNPLSDKAGAKVAGEASRKLREILDSKIESAGKLVGDPSYQQLRNAYSQLKSIEPAVINAFKKSNGGSKLGDAVSGLAVVDSLQGLITANPSQIVRGGLIESAKQVLNQIKDPEIAMQRAFRLINNGGKEKSEVLTRFMGK